MQGSIQAATFPWDGKILPLPATARRKTAEPHAPVQNGLRAAAAMPMAYIRNFIRQSTRTAIFVLPETPQITLRLGLFAQTFAEEIAT